MQKQSEPYQNIAVAPEQEFIDAIPAMYAPLKEYVTRVIPLMLEHAWQRSRTNNTSVFDELLYSGWICRLITLDNRVLNREQQNEINGWPEVREYLMHCLDDCRDESELHAMNDRCMKYIQPILESRFEANYRFPERTFHCWWYTIHDANSHVALHLINAYQPQSPFAHLEHFLTTMLQAVEHAVSIHPLIKIVSCGSWLNALPKFQALWPASFRNNQKILNASGGFGPGAWGQYMDTAGRFNEEKAAILRQTGKHPFALTEGHSPVDELIAHLRQSILSFSKSHHG